jgi:protein-S-isoprenylcysteine O-methyltransferase Ste14
MQLPGPDVLFNLLWGGWVISWVVAASWSSRAVATPARGEIWLYRGAVTLGFILLTIGGRHPWRADRLWDVGYRGAQTLALLTIPGFLFTWWARLHLGRLWSGTVTRKQNHHVVDTGPYALVRHPIYTGLIEACLVSAIAAGTVISLAGFAIITFGFWLKASLEERFLMQQLGPEAYGAYRRRVPMLLPIHLG